MSKYYIIAIFTASTQEYADIVCDQLDTDKLIKYRFYRQNCTPVMGRILILILRLLHQGLEYVPEYR